MFVHLKEQLPLATFNASTIIQDLSSSQRAESARAVTGTHYPHSGMGEDFLARQPFFFLHKNGRFSETKNKKNDPKVQN